MKRDSLPLAANIEPVDRGLPAVWRAPLLCLAIALTLVCLGFFSTVSSIVKIWANSETFAHGFVVVPISLWLIWRIRDRLRALTPSPSPGVLPLIALAGIAWLLGEFGAVNVLSQLAFVTILVLTITAVLGMSVARAMMFPLGFLFFAVPIGDFLLPTLMERTADFTVAALRLSGVPVYREGLLMIIPNGWWSIVEACSGVRYLIASLMTGTLFGYLNYSAPWRRWMFVGVSIVVPIVANWIRAYMIVMLGYLSNNRLAVGVDHLIYGWVFFGFVMLLMFWIGAKWRDPQSALSPPMKKVGHIGGTRAPSMRSLVGMVTAVAAVTLTWPAAAILAEQRNDVPVTLTAVDIAGWERPTPRDVEWEPHLINPSATLHEPLRRGSTAGGIYIAYYRNQNSQSKVANSANSLVAENRGWVRTVVASVDVPMAGTTTKVEASALRGPGGTGILAWRWYWINGSLTSSDLVAKARTAWLRLSGQHDDSATVIVYVEDTDPQRASATLANLAQAAWPSIASMLQRAGDQRQVAASVLEPRIRPH